MNAFLRAPHPTCCGLALTIATILAQSPALSASTTEDAWLREVIVTGARTTAPLTVVTDPKTPRQPLPAHDGADYLKTIPGFSVIRKGGTSGDPIFRSMAASRLNMLLDGEQSLGGCGMRMDPPTAYVFPESYDRIIVIKGPQTVLHGPGNSAATVLFDRDTRRFDTAGIEGTASAIGGSHSRNDLVGDLLAGTPTVQARLTGTRAEAGDYEDGDGNTVHGEYRRWSANGAVSFTPDASTRIEIGGATSDGEAAYADRMMDGAKFARENLSLKVEKSGLGEHVDRVEFMAYYNYIDHVMDNYSLRTFTPSMMMPQPAASNPDRRTTGGQFKAELTFAGDVSATVGLDVQDNRHTDRSTMNQTMLPFESLARTVDAQFGNRGVFGELTVAMADGQRLIGGLRADRWSATDKRGSLRIGMMTMPNPTAGKEREATLTSGFARYERDLGGTPTTFYAGVGHVERFPDYWELISASKESAGSLSAFDTSPERTTQLDTGVLYRNERLSLSLSGFLGRVDDYILIEANYLKGARATTVTRNVDARTWGGEADMSYALADRWTVTGTLAYTRGDNLTDDRPLAQVSPLETRLGVQYSANAWSAGALWRWVDSQGRYALNQGNIVGQDLGPSSGFSVLSLNGAWQPRQGMSVSAGVDNLLDIAYAEHLSRGGAMVSGYQQTQRVNEPGRTLWMRVGVQFK